MLDLFTYTCNSVNIFLIYLRVDYYVQPGFSVSYHLGEFKCFLPRCHYFSLNSILHGVTICTFLSCFLPWCIFPTLFKILCSIFIFYKIIYIAVSLKKSVLEYLSFNWWFTLLYIYHNYLFERFILSYFLLSIYPSFFKSTSLTFYCILFDW